MFISILHKNAAFLLLCGNTEGTSYGRKRSGGVYPKGTLRRGLVPEIQN